MNAIVNALLGPVTGIFDTVIKRILPEKMSEAEKEGLKAEFIQAILQFDWSVVEQQVRVLLAELTGNWLQRSWRPILMLSIVAIVVNNYILFPYASLFGLRATMLELPVYLWDLLKIGVGGYIVGRSAEKIVETWKGKQG